MSSLAFEQTSPSQEPETSKRQNHFAFKKLLPYLSPYKTTILKAFIAIVLASVSVISFGAGIKFVIDQGFSASNPNTLNEALIFMFIGVLVLAGSSFARFYYVSWLGERIVTDLRQKLFHHLISLDCYFFETNKVGELLSRLTTDTTLLQTIIGSSLSIAFRNVLLFIGGLVMLFYTSPGLTSLVFAVVPFVIIPIILLGRRVKRLSQITQEKVANISSFSEENLTFIKTVQAFGQETYIDHLFCDQLHQSFKASERKIRFRAMLTFIVILLIFGAVGILLWIGGHRVLTDNMSTGDLSSFIFYAIIVASSIGALSETAGDINRASGALERIFELLKSRPHIVSPTNAQIMPDSVKGEIDFAHVNFSYPSRPNYKALNDFSLHIRPGEKVAIVGPSGAGKSTIFDLLLRFYTPQEGKISCDQLAITQLDLHDLRGLYALVPQDPVIFSTSVLENIRYAQPEASIDQVVQAAEFAHIHDFILTLPHTYDTHLGEKGVRLSGGQKQRFSLARAILKNPKILLLDEATSALDTENERLIQDSLIKFMENRTTLIIAHRLSTIRHVDRIIVMDQGKIVQSGSHDDLIQRDGLYSKLAKMQYFVS